MGLQENLSHTSVPIPIGVEQALSQQTVLNTGDQAGERPHICHNPKKTAQRPLKTTAGRRSVPKGTEDWRDPRVEPSRQLSLGSCW